MSGSVIKTFANERLLASSLGISFFPRSLWGSCQGTYSSPRRQNFPEVSYLGKNRSHLKNQVSLVWRFTWCGVAWQFSGQSQDGDLLQLVLWRHRRVRRIMTYLIFNLIFLLEEEEITQLLAFDMTVRELKLWRRRRATRTANKEKGYRDKRQTL